MCYHTALIATPRQLARRYRRKADLILQFPPAYRVSGFSHAEYPVVTTDERIQYYRWGLIPHWIDGVEDAVAIRNRTLNARAESIFAKPSFREPIRKRRCLVPASGFFDWHQAEGRKIPYYISVRSQPIVSLAGIWDCWYNRMQDEWVGTYSVITTEANPLMRRIHNTNFRMPVILHPEDEERWLDPALDEGQIAALLRPFPDAEMQAVAIRNDFIRKPAGDPTILMPAAEGVEPVK